MKKIIASVVAGVMLMGATPKKSEASITWGAVLTGVVVAASAVVVGYAGYCMYQAATGANDKPIDPVIPVIFAAGTTAGATAATSKNPPKDIPLNFETQPAATEEESPCGETKSDESDEPDFAHMTCEEFQAYADTHPDCPNITLHPDDKGE